MRGNRIQREWIFQFLEEDCAKSLLPECYARSMLLQESHAMSRLLENFTTTLMLVTARLLPITQQAKVARRQLKSVVKHRTLTKMGILNPVLYFPVSRGSTSFKGLRQC